MTASNRIRWSRWIALVGATGGTIVLAAAGALRSGAHADAPAGRYVVSAETILDTQTQLVWQRTPPASPATRIWASALAYCATGSGLPGAGWRLPTIKELQTLVDERATMPPLIDPAFAGAVAAQYWSSTPHVVYNDDAWLVDFTTGAAEFQNTQQAGFAYRCVRTGP